MNKEGYFGNFGGRFVPEALRPPLMELEEAMATIMPSREYRDALQDLLVNYAGRETPLTFCPHLSEKLGFRLWLKRRTCCTPERTRSITRWGRPCWPG